MTVYNFQINQMHKRKIVSCKISVYACIYIRLFCDEYSYIYIYD